jgi:hypothetical protein
MQATVVQKCLGVVKGSVEETRPGAAQALGEGQAPVC